MRGKIIKVLTALLVWNTAGAWAEDGVQEGRIVLGQPCVLQGPAAALGESMRTGLRVYFDRINASGGLRGRRVDLVSVNDNYEPEGARAAVKTLLEKDRVFLLIGSVGTPTAEAILPLLQAAKVPLIGPFTGAEFLRDPFQKYVINLRGSYYQEMDKLAQHLVEQKRLRRIACFYQEDSFGQAGLQGLKLALQRRGLELVATGSYERNTTKIEAGLNAILPARPEAVVLVGTYQPVSLFIQKAMGSPDMARSLFCTISFVGSHALLSSLGHKGEGLISQVLPYPGDDSVPVVAEYRSDMTKAGLKDQINYVTLEGYLAAKFFSQAWLAMDAEPSREEFIATVEERRIFDLGGITLNYSPSDHQGMEDIFLTRFKNGKELPLGR